MSSALGGPMFEPATTEYRESVVSRRERWSKPKEGAHYNIYGADDDRAIEFLRHIFPAAVANEMNFVLFSTSGIHGSGCTIEDAERTLERVQRGEKPDDELTDEEWEAERDSYTVSVTFLLVQPRIVSMTCGNCHPKSMDDIEFMKRLRQSSWDVVREIGNPADAPRIVHGTVYQHHSSSDDEHRIGDGDKWFIDEDDFDMTTGLKSGTKVTLIVHKDEVSP